MSSKAYHGRTQYTFTGRVNDFAEPRRLAMAFPATRSSFGGWSSAPDMGIYRWANVPWRADRKVLTDSRTPWDIAVEIVTPDQSRSDIENKCRWFCANGVEITLMIDPDHEGIERFGADGSRIVLRNDDRINLNSNSVMPGFQRTPDDLFAALYAD